MDLTTPKSPKVIFNEVDVLIHDTLEGIKYNGHRIHDMSTRFNSEVLQKNALKSAEDNLDKTKNTHVIQSFDVMRTAVKKCTRCELHITRTYTVFGEGAENPILMVIGDAPRDMDDLEGKPFVGEVGRYLDKWLTAINVSREKDVFVTNTVKCRPLHNEDPKLEEYSACNIFLARQVMLLKPKCILAVGKIAGCILTETGKDVSFESMRKQKKTYNNIPVFVTRHPSEVLKNPSYKKDVWEDLQIVGRFLKTCV